MKGGGKRGAKSSVLRALYSLLVALKDDIHLVL